VNVTRGSTFDVLLPPFFFSLIVSFLNRDTTASLVNRRISVCAKRMSCYSVTSDFTTRLNRPSMASASCFAINAVFSSSAYTFSQQSLLKLSYLQSTCHVLCPNNTARYDARKLFCRVASGRAVCNRHYATRYKCDMRLLFFVTP